MRLATVRHALLRAVPVLAGFAIAACIIQEPAPRSPQALPSNQQPAEGASGAAVAASGGAVPDGDYSCSLVSDEYQYPPFRCVVATAADGGQVLDKVGGSQRIRGRITPTASGFYFDGLFYCPWGACDARTSGEFVHLGAQTYRGTLPTQSGAVVVTLTFAPGGLGYGGAAYGGRAYGGRSYMAVPPPSPAF